MQSSKVIRTLLLAAIIAALSATCYAQVSVGVSVRIGPPPLPVYVQPPVPAPGYIWVPGYWAYGEDGYYWVPGTWVLPPTVGVLWTPGYWGWVDGFYIWHVGYWGPHVGFYGGIPYGFGYTGVGFAGGYWAHGVYNYNRSVTNVNVTNVTNVYNTTVINNNTSRVSYNGGAGGIHAQPTGAEQAAAREHHFSPTGVQMQHQHVAGGNRALLASTNHGQPTIAASPKAGVFSGQGVVAAGKSNSQASAGGNNSFKPFSANKTGNGPGSGNGNSGVGSGKGFGTGNGNGNNSYKPNNARVNDMRVQESNKSNNSYKPNNTRVNDMRVQQNNNHVAYAPPPPHSGRSSSGEHHNNNNGNNRGDHKKPDR